MENLHPDEIKHYEIKGKGGKDPKTEKTVDSKWLEGGVRETTIGGKEK